MQVGGRPSTSTRAARLRAGGARGNVRATVAVNREGAMGDSAPQQQAPRGPTMRGLVAGALATMPLSVSFVPFGVAFGIAAVEKGIDPTTATIWSALVCGGASQFAVLDLWKLPLPVALIVLTVLVVNSRHLLYGAVLYPRLAVMPRRVRYPLLGVMTDSCFAYAVQIGNGKPGEERDEMGLLLGGGGFVYLSWIVSTWLGATLGVLIGNTKTYALDVVMVAYFSAVLAGMWQSRADFVPWIAAGLGTVAGLWFLPTGWHVIAGGLAGGLAGFIADAD